MMAYQMPVINVSLAKVVMIMMLVQQVMYMMQIVIVQEYFKMRITTEFVMPMIFVPTVMIRSM